MQIKVILHLDDFSGFLRWIEQTKILIARAAFISKMSWITSSIILCGAFLGALEAEPILYHIGLKEKC